MGKSEDNIAKYLYEFMVGRMVKKTRVPATLITVVRQDNHRDNVVYLPFRMDKLKEVVYILNKFSYINSVYDDGLDEVIEELFRFIDVMGDINLGILKVIGSGQPVGEGYTGSYPYHMSIFLNSLESKMHAMNSVDVGVTDEFINADPSLKTEYTKYNFFKILSVVQSEFQPNKGKDGFPLFHTSVLY